MKRTKFLCASLGYRQLLLLVWACLGLRFSGFSQQEPDAEALLTFSHPAVGQVYISAAIFGDTPYLPMGEVLSLLEIPARQVMENRGFAGAYPGDKDLWQINPTQFRVSLRGQNIPSGADDFYLGELDLFIHPRLFEELFGLRFTMNAFALSLSMEARHPLPVVERRKREQLRSRLLQPGGRGNQEYAPLLYARERKWMQMGMMDYNINHIQSPAGSLTSGLFNIGLEALGGDMVGTVNASRTSEGVRANVQGLRWRYVLPGAMEPDRNLALTTISVGDVFTTGQSQLGSIMGISLSNDPIVPRQQLDFFIIDGYTEADSEVEMLIGGQLVEFTRADEVGYYRFNAPINFGTLRLTIRIYTPQGKVIQEDRQIQIPFTFLPRGFVTYNIQAGLPRIAADSLGFQPVAHADVAVGISNSLTARVGTDYDLARPGEIPYSFLGLSARVFQQYLVNAELVPRRYAQANASVFLPNNTNFTAQFKEYFSDSLYNPRGNIRDLSLNYFMPFKILGKMSGFRIGGTRQETELRARNTLQGDFNTQVGRAVARVNFRGNLNEFYPSETEVGFNDFGGLLTGSLTYTLSRSPGTPVFVRGMFIRGQYVYNPFTETAQSWSVLLSQTLFKRGRFTLGYDRNMLNKTGRLQVGFLYDFNFFRTATQFQQSGRDYSLQQSFSGSLAYDPFGLIVPNNRDQVNRAGVAVRLFIDDNDNGVYDEGEEIVPSVAVRLDRSAFPVLGSDGILRLSQLQSYWTYRMEIDRNALPDPTLSPKRAVFSFVADPNHYRMIDVPLYRTGVIEGSVFQTDAQGQQLPVGGLRLFLASEDGNVETIRTFGDGGFYAYGLIPGVYRLLIDPQQLAYMNKISNPGIREFEVAALSEGAYLEGLDFRLERKDLPELLKGASLEAQSSLSEAQRETLEFSLEWFAIAQELAIMDQLDQALEAIDRSLEYLETAQALALKGSIYYLMRNEDKAWEYWTKAKEKNPEIIIPERN